MTKTRQELTKNCVNTIVKELTKMNQNSLCKETVKNKFKQQQLEKMY